MADVVLKPVPYNPLPILTPPLHQQPDEHTLQLIQAAVDRICADDTVYSVTHSPVLCPEDKRYLYILHPHYWEKDDGTWDCELPQGQKQLDALCIAIRDLALGVEYLPDESAKKAANERAKQLLKVFFVDEETKMLPEVEYAQVIPGEEGNKGNSLFVIPVGAPSLPLLDLDPELESRLKAWFRAHVDWMQTSAAGKECTERDDNKPFWYYAPLATHLNYLDPPAGQALAREYLDRVIRLRPTPAEFFAKAVIRADPRHCTLFLLEPTSILAHLAQVSDSTLEYLEQLVGFAKTVQPGQVDGNSDNDERYFRKLALFERILAVMRGDEAGAGLSVDGKGWEGGWGEFLAISWALLGTQLSDKAASGIEKLDHPFF